MTRIQTIQAAANAAGIRTTLVDDVLTLEHCPACGGGPTSLKVLESGGLGSARECACTPAASAAAIALLEAAPPSAAPPAAVDPWDEPDDAPATDPNYTVTVSPGPKNNANGRRVQLDSNAPVASLQVFLNSCPSSAEAWWSWLTWSSDHRTAADWQRAVAIVADLDYIADGWHGPATVQKWGEHQIAPPDAAASFRAAVATGTMPGNLWHSTPRGTRVIAVLATPCTDAAAYRLASQGFAQQLDHWLRAQRLNADRGAHVVGYEADHNHDLARYMFTPRSLVGGIQRDAHVELLSTAPADLGVLAASAPTPPAKPVAVAHPRPSAAAASRFEDAAARYNLDRGQPWGRPGSTNCPVCCNPGGCKCFGALKDSDSSRWACFNTDHPRECGHPGPSNTCFVGDALDIDAYLSHATPAEYLRSEGYLTAGGALTTMPPPSDDVPPPGDADCPPEFRPVPRLSLAPAAAPDPSGDADATAEPPPANVTPLHPATPPLGGEPPVIRIGTDEERVNDEAVAALCTDPRVFQRSHCLVKVIRGITSVSGCQRSPDALTITGIPQPQLREMLAACATWAKYEKAAGVKTGAKAANGAVHDDAAPDSLPKWRKTHPPTWTVQAVGSRGRWEGIRPLEAVLEWPIIRRDGTLLADPGYDDRTGLYYEPSGPVDAVPQIPTDEELHDALAALRETVCDFPFEVEAGFSAWLAALLTPLARYSFDGPSPLFFAEANTRGSGKSLLWETISILLTGRKMAGMPYTDDDEEMGKQITSSAIAGDSLIFIDNISGNFGGSNMDRALTLSSWKARILGHSENTPEIPLHAVWYGTGNNPTLCGDIDRRMAVCRLNSPLEHPEDREGFKHYPLLPWVHAERHRILAAALTILRAYAVCGSPRGKGKLWGSYEGWSRTVKCCIEWLGLPAPLKPASAGLASSDIEELGAFLAAWDMFDHSHTGLTAPQFLDHLEAARKDAEAAHQPLEAVLGICVEALGGPKAKTSSKSMGHRIRKWRGRVHGSPGKCFRECSHKAQGGVLLWRVAGAAEAVSGEQPAPEPLQRPLFDVAGGSAQAPSDGAQSSAAADQGCVVPNSAAPTDLGRPMREPGED